MDDVETTYASVRFSAKLQVLYGLLLQGFYPDTSRLSGEDTCPRIAVAQRQRPETTRAEGAAYAVPSHVYSHIGHHPWTLGHQCWGDVVLHGYYCLIYADCTPYSLLHLKVQEVFHTHAAERAVRSPYMCRTMRLSGLFREVDHAHCR